MHPQFWPEDLDYAGKEVVVIGSGATAVTLIPSMADAHEHVTMLQRSPTYITALPAGRHDRRSACARCCPPGSRTASTRRKNAAIAIGFYLFCQRLPEARAEGPARPGAASSCPEDFDVEALHADATTRGTSACASSRTATCSARIRRGKASIVTDQIAAFTPTGIELESGRAPRRRHRRHRDGPAGRGVRPDRPRGRRRDDRPARHCTSTRG